MTRSVDREGSLHLVQDSDETREQFDEYTPMADEEWPE